jgi:hypothetical protein
MHTLIPLRRPRRRPRGFDLIQLAIALFFVALLAALAWSTFAGPAEDVRSGYVDIALRSIDVEARSLARESGSSVDPGQFLRQVVGEPAGGEHQGCPRGGMYPLPEDECALDDDDPNRYRLHVDTSTDPAIVTMVRHGACGRLVVDPSGREHGEIVRCDVHDPS